MAISLRDPEKIDIEGCHRCLLMVEWLLVCWLGRGPESTRLLIWLDLAAVLLIHSSRHYQEIRQSFLCHMPTHYFATDKHQHTQIQGMTNNSSKWPTPIPPTDKDRAGGLGEWSQWWATGGTPAETPLPGEDEHAHHYPVNYWAAVLL